MKITFREIKGIEIVEFYILYNFLFLYKGKIFSNSNCAIYFFLGNDI